MMRILEISEQDFECAECEYISNDNVRDVLSTGKYTHIKIKETGELYDVQYVRYDSGGGDAIVGERL